MNFLKKSVCVSMVAAIALTCCVSMASAEKKAVKVEKPTTKVEKSAEKPHEFQLPKPTAEHQWLQQLVGKWSTDVEAFDPSTKAMVKSKGSNTIEPVGGFWIVDKIDGTMMNQPFKGVMTTGYDEKSQKFVSTWVDSVSGKLWQYDGQLDDAKKVLTFQTEGECPMQPGKLVKFKDEIELKDPDHLTYTSYMQDEKGEWSKMMTSESTRQK